MVQDVPTPQPVAEQKYAIEVFALSGATRSSPLRINTRRKHLL